MGRWGACSALAVIAACGHSHKGASDAAADTGGVADAADAAIDAAIDAPADASIDAPMAHSNIKHLVIIVLEDQTFETHFGSYCTATPGANPTCTTGPSCCEAAPTQDPSGASAVSISDAEHASYRPTSTATCEVAELDSGAMDKFVTGASCSNAQNFGLIASSTAKPFQDLAASGALADRYFQPIAGGRSGNEMFFARAGYVFTDNLEPTGAIASACQPVGSFLAAQTDPTIADLLASAGWSTAVYAEGYQAAVAAAAASTCPSADASCPSSASGYPCTFDPGGVALEYYTSTRDHLVRDYSTLATDLAGNAFPAVAWVKPFGFRSEHPGGGITLSAASTFVVNTLSTISGSSYASTTLVLVTWDQGGGYFDHVAPPAANSVDGQPYGTRVPLIALGPFAKTNAISHVTMEHSSLVKFIEWNWLGGQTGQLGTRDTTVNNIGSLLDASATGIAVP
jgi:phospholipase C